MNCYFKVKDFGSWICLFLLSWHAIIIIFLKVNKGNSIMTWTHHTPSNRFLDAMSISTSGLVCLSVHHDFARCLEYTNLEYWVLASWPQSIEHWPPSLAFWNHWVLELGLKCILKKILALFFPKCGNFHTLFNPSLINLLFK